MAAPSEGAAEPDAGWVNSPDVAGTDLEPTYVDAKEVALRLGVGVDWVYDHQQELGASALGDGPKPRLRFRMDLVMEAMDCRRVDQQAQTAKAVVKRPAKRKQRGSTHKDGYALPLRERR